MFHFNTHTRTTFFHHDVSGGGLDHCFDCMSEIFILRKWFALPKNGGMPSDGGAPLAGDGSAQLPAGGDAETDADADAPGCDVASLSRELSRRISSTGRTL